MGEDADYFLDQALLSDMFYDMEQVSTQRVISPRSVLKRRFKDNVWTTKDGQTMLLTDMETRHIKNSLRYIAARGPNCVYGFGSKWVSKLEQELQSRNKKLPSLKTDVSI